MWANPEVYSEIPLHVAVEGTADSVTAQVDDEAPVDASYTGSGDWVADVPIAGLADGIHDLEVTVLGPGADPIGISAELGTGTEGVQLTDFEVVGMAGVVRLHRVGREAWLTWTDRSEGDAEAWLRKMDGAGRWTTEKVALVGAPEETLYARTAVGASSIGVLYQAHGSPYANHFKAVDFDGAELMEAVDLDPSGWNGSFGGDVAFDGDGYVLAWRLNDGTGGGQVRWMRVEESTWETTGPVLVAETGPGDSTDIVGGFEPFSFVDVAAIGGMSIVGFVRSRYDSGLDIAVPKGQLALLGTDGTIQWSDYAGVDDDWTWHRECRTFEAADTFVAVWSAANLIDDDLPNYFFAAQTDSEGALDPDRGAGTLMLEQVDDRDEPFFVPHADRFGVLAWWDHRAYTFHPSDGRIELYAAPVSASLELGDDVVFEHARCVAGTTHLHGAPAGTNVMLVWRDERHGSGILDPKPEAWFETVWF
jgi:hypothetical protein